MGTNEIILIIAIPLVLFLIYSSLETIKNLYNTGKISVGNRYVLIYISVVIPLLGFAITKFLERKNKKSIA